MELHEKPFWLEPWWARSDVHTRTTHVHARLIKRIIDSWHSELQSPERASGPILSLSVGKTEA